MKWIGIVLVSVLLAGGAVAGGRRASPERVVSGDGVIPAMIGGVKARIRIDPGATAMPLLIDGIAARAGLKPTMFGVRYGVGPIRIPGATGLEEIAFGVERPVRTLTLGAPLRLGALAVATLGVRTADIGNVSTIRDADEPTPDPDEVVVTAKMKRDPNRDRLALGRDQLDRCSSIVFDKPARQVRLACL